MANTTAASRPLPTVPVEGGLCIIGAGLGRTGTSTLQEALEILGYGPCYHMREVYKDPFGLDRWDKVGRGISDKDTKWDVIFHGYRSTVDHPAASYWQELTEYYPDANVILTIRDEEKWWTSFYETICPASTFWSILRRLTLVTSTKASRMVRNCIWNKTFGGIAGARNKERAIAVFREHNQRVRDTIPSNKLLVMDVREGWEPLCAFLECPVPDAPFPRAWDSKQFKIMIARSRRKAVQRLVGAVVVGLSIGYSLLWTRKRQS